MLIKSNYIQDAYPCTKDLVHYYSPFVNCHIYFFCAFGCRRVAIVNSRGYYQVVCAGWLPDFFEVDLLPPAKVRSFWFKDWKPLLRTKDFNCAISYFKRCVMQLQLSDIAVNSDEVDDVQS